MGLNESVFCVFNAESLKYLKYVKTLKIYILKSSLVSYSTESGSYRKQIYF